MPDASLSPPSPELDQLDLGPAFAPLPLSSGGRANGSGQADGAMPPPLPRAKAEVPFMCLTFHSSSPLHRLYIDEFLFVFLAFFFF